MCECVGVFEKANENCFRDNKIVYVNGSRVSKYDFESQKIGTVRWKIAFSLCANMQCANVLCAPCRCWQLYELRTHETSHFSSHIPKRKRARRENGKSEFCSVWFENIEIFYVQRTMYTDYTYINYLRYMLHILQTMERRTPHTCFNATRFFLFFFSHHTHWMRMKNKMFKTSKRAIKEKK